MREKILVRWKSWRDQDNFRLCLNVCISEDRDKILHILFHFRDLKRKKKKVKFQSIQWNGDIIE